ncbi:hypothetical protein HGB13_03175, partial [bacterium]|nr:hypothetical protein [bacterium]
MTKKDFEIKELTSWNIIEECLAEKTASGYKMAMIEGNIAGASAAAHRAVEAAGRANYPAKAIIQRARVEMGREPDPIVAFRAGGYLQKIGEERI